jgi:hypothetical protein
MSQQEHSKRASTTKRGPGRYATQGTPGNRISKDRPVRAYKALMDAWAQKRVPKWQGPRDEHGAYTQVGKVRTAPSNDHPDEFDIFPRRIWLAGISAQRGY